MNGRSVLRLTALAALAAAALGALALAVPVESWRTGRAGVAPLGLSPAGAHRIAGRRIWIDTDAACGASRTTDVDDCLALIALLKAPRLQVAGISTVFGNAALATTDRTTRELADRLEREGVPTPPVGRGRDARIAAGRQAAATPAERLLAKAIEAEPLVIVALGPLTNIAALLDRRPELARRVRHVVAVMGQRRGHVFHPSEGGRAGTLLGHGPVFSDMNFAKDPEAVQRLLSHDIPVTLIPYDAARSLPVAPEHVARLAQANGAPAWVAARSGGWLAFWTDDIGQRGFFPFDLAAAGFLLRPDSFRCVSVGAAIGGHPWPWSWVLGERTLLVRPGKGSRRRQIAYCPWAHPAVRDVLLDAVVAEPGPAGRSGDAALIPGAGAPAGNAP